MIQPTVCAILLTADRPEMTRRAVECFKAQTYENKRLLIYDSGLVPFCLKSTAWASNRLYYEYFPEDRGLTIGALRNLAMAFAHPLCLNADIIVHFDSDDVSNPNRIAEQVALLQASGADCVGYNSMLFWRDGNAPHAIGEEPDTWDGAQAWLYSNYRSNYALGTSLCYWRKTWEKKPFADTSSGEDLRFIEGLNVQACTSKGAIFGLTGDQYKTEALQYGRDKLSDEVRKRSKSGALAAIDSLLEMMPKDALEPRMVARIHGGNTHCRIVDQSHEPEHLRQWKRVPEWDERLRKVMELK